MDQRTVSTVSSISAQLSHVGFFILRTPLLPFDDLLAWGEGLTAADAVDAGVGDEAIARAWESDIARLRERLRALLDRPDVTQSLFIASPSLDIGIDRWRTAPDSRKGVRAERSLVRYVARMCGRATPFGLFSGYSVGQIADAPTATPTLSLVPRPDYRVVSRLDFEYLFALTARLVLDPAAVPHLRYWTNSSLHRTGDAWQYVESRAARFGRTHHAVRLETDEFLEAVIERAAHGARLEDLTQVLRRRSSETDADLTEQDIDEYLRDLVRHNVLVSSLSPLVTGDPCEDLIAQLDEIPPLGHVGAALRSVREAMVAIDAKALGACADDYRALAATLDGLPVKPDLSRLCQVDMTKPAASAVLTPQVMDEVGSALDVWYRLGGVSEPEALRTFREAFISRYDRATVPLLTALDSERGIGFDESGTDSAPLVRGLKLSPDAAEPGTAADSTRGRTMDDRHLFLLRKLIDRERPHGEELELQPSEIPIQQIAARSVPSSCAVVAILIAESAHAIAEGRFALHLKGAVGPGGARLFGRFCHTDPELHQCVQDYVQREAAHDPEHVYMEIVHLPEGRIGNVLCRPVLRDYELVFLGRSGAPLDRQIPLTDLLISIENGTIVLTSRRLAGRRIMPRLSNAHGFLNRQLSPAYRFLCCLQQQHAIAGPGSLWGPLEALDDLPRIRVGRVVLNTARWRLRPKTIAQLAAATRVGRFVEMQRLRRARGLPRWVLFEEGDNALPVDLDNALTVDALIHVLARAPEAVLREMYPPPDQLCVTGPEGRFVHELNIPFVRRPTRQDQAIARPAGGVHRMVSSRVRSQPPGGEWLYVKLYGGRGDLDDVLRAAAPVVSAVAEAGAIDRWFFVRFLDPDVHLRMRFQGPPDRLRTDVWPVLSKAFDEWLASGLLWKIQLDTYEREIERYGGPDGMLVAEEIFCADSQAVLDVLRELDGDDTMDDRWRAALVGIDAMLADFGLDLAAKRLLTKDMVDAFHREFGIAGQTKQALAWKCRIERSKVVDALEPSSATPDVLANVRQAFARRSSRVVTAAGRIAQLRESGRLHNGLSELLPSFVHMHVNRLTRSQWRQHELVLYELLFRYYDGKHARSRASMTASAGGLT